MRKAVVTILALIMVAGAFAETRYWDYKEKVILDESVWEFGIYYPDTRNPIMYQVANRKDGKGLYIIDKEYESFSEYNPETGMLEFWFLYKDEEQ